MVWIALWLIGASLLAFALYGSDKFRAKRGGPRISEALLLTVAALGGGFGAMMGMQIFRHKTKRLKFLLGVPLCFLFNAVVVWILIQLLSQ